MTPSVQDDASKMRTAVGLIGSAGTDDLLPFCRQLGSALARAGFALVTGTSDIGKWTAESFHAEVSDSQRILFVVRERPQRALPPFGTILHTGTDRDSYRSALLDRAQIAVVVRGGSSSQQEVERAQQRKLPILPIAGTGGTARAIAGDLRADLEKLGVDAGSLDGLTNEHTDPGVLANRAVAILKSLSNGLQIRKLQTTALLEPQSDSPLETEEQERFFSDPSTASRKFVPDHVRGASVQGKVVQTRSKSS